jgi:hypothetical protein
MVRLAARREVRQPSPSPPYLDSDRECSPEELPQPKREDIPLLLGKTQCIYCVGDERLTYGARMRKFKRVSHMRDHVKTSTCGMKRKQQTSYAAIPIAKILVIS